MTNDEAERVRSVILSLAWSSGYSRSGMEIEAIVGDLDDILGEFMWLKDGPIFVQEKCNVKRTD